MTMTMTQGKTTRATMASMDFPLDFIDQVTHVNRHAVERGELRQVVLELGLEVLGGGGRHGLDDDVAQVAVAVAQVRLHLRRALHLAHRRPRLLAELGPARRLRHLGEQLLQLARAVARVGHEQRLLA